MMFFMLFLAYAGIVLFFFGYSAAAWVIRSSAMAASTRGALIEFYHLFFQADDPDFLNRNRFQKRRMRLEFGLGDRFWFEVDVSKVGG